MEFFNIGPGELLFIALLAILVVGPKRSVQLMQQAGRLLARLQQEWRTIQRDIMTEVQAVRDEVSLDTSDWITSPRPTSRPVGGGAKGKEEATADGTAGRSTDEKAATSKIADGTTGDAARGDASHPGAH
jgi:Sec-independent protein translocase protein TatA